MLDSLGAFVRNQETQRRVAERDYECRSDEFRDAMHEEQTIRQTICLKVHELVALYRP